MSHRGKEELTSILTGDEINPVAELDLEIAMAHKILHTNSGDDAGLQTARATDRVAENPRICHRSYAFPRVFGVFSRRVNRRRRNDGAPKEKLWAPSHSLWARSMDRSAVEHFCRGHWREKFVLCLAVLVYKWTISNTSQIFFFYLDST